MSDTGLNNVLNQSRLPDTSRSQGTENRREVPTETARIPQETQNRINDLRPIERTTSATPRERTNRNDTNTGRETRSIAARVDTVNQNGEVALTTSEGHIDVTVIDPEILRELETYAREQRSTNTNTQNLRVQITSDNSNGQTTQTVSLSLPPEPPSREVIPADVRHSTTPVDINLQASQIPAEPDIQTYTLSTSDPLPARAFRLEQITAEQAVQYISTANAAEQNTLQTAQNTVEVAAQIASEQRNTISATAKNNTANVQNIAEPPIRNVTLKSTATNNQSRESIIQQALSAIKNVTSDPIQTTQITVQTSNPSTIQLQGQEGSISTQLAQTSSMTIPASPLSITNIATDTPIQIVNTAEQSNITVEISKKSVNAQSVKAGEIGAQVIGQTEKGLPVIAISPDQFGNNAPQNTLYFTLQASFADIIPGTDITLIPQTTLGSTPQISGDSTASQNTAGLSTTPLQNALGILPPLLLTDAWPVMNQITNVLSQTAPQLVQSFIATIPSPANPAQMAPAALFFMAAIGAGDMTGWLGQRASDTLRRSGNGNLVTQLSQDGSSITKMGAEPIQSGDWRTMTLPMMMQNEIHKATIYYKREDESTESDTSGAKPVRFVMNMGFDKIGDIQLDALFKPERLDMVLRSTQTFSANMRQDMRSIYADALKQATIGGELQFQTDVQSWVKILEDNERNHQVDV